jgi:hypothetical protein
VFQCSHVLSEFFLYQVAGRKGPQNIHCSVTCFESFVDRYKRFKGSHSIRLKYYGCRAEPTKSMGAMFWAFGNAANMVRWPMVFGNVHSNRWTFDHKAKWNKFVAQKISG